MTISSLRKRIRPDNLKTQVRAGGRSLARRLYLASVVILLAFISYYFIGPFFLLEADGLLVRDRSVVAAISNSRVVEVHVQPGEQVKKGMLLLTVQSPDVLMEFGRYQIRRADIIRREAEIQRRLETISSLKPLAASRKAKATVLDSAMSRLEAGRFASASHSASVARDAYDATRELALLEAEERSLHEEVDVQAKMRTDLDTLIQQLESAYDYGHRGHVSIVDYSPVGHVHSPTDGQVGPRVAYAGQVARIGDPLLEIFTGSPYVLAYLPTARAYDITAGDEVIVTDGAHRVGGEVELPKDIADTMPSEFQRQFAAVERGEIFRVKLKDQPPFVLLSQVRVVSSASPSNILALMHAAQEYLQGKKPSHTH